MPARILQGDVLSVLPTLPADSFDCAVTSPPYWMLRSYLPGGHALKGSELGSELTPDAYVDNMVRVFREVRRVLAPHGVCWCNIGDTYTGGGRGGGGRDSLGSEGVASPLGLAPGNLTLIPQRLALALQADGWIVRSVVVWHKPSPMPASLSGWRWQRCRVKVRACQGRSNSKAVGDGVRSRNPNSSRNPELNAQWADCPGCDRCRPHGGYVLRRGSWRCTSDWEPLLMLAKSGRYFGDGEAVKTESKDPEGDLKRINADRNKTGSQAWQEDGRGGGHQGPPMTVAPAGANLRDVWTIAAEPLREKHYAAFPTELVYRCLASITSQRGYCPECGAPWARVVETKNGSRTEGVRNVDRRVDGFTTPQWKVGEPRLPGETTTLGWRPSCTCGDLEPRPARVLDPFAGSGRVGVQALRMGMDFTGVELSPEYCAMARRILAEESPLFGGVE